MKRFPWRTLGILSASVGVVVLASGLWAQPAGGRLLVHFINVGQADGILITDEATTCRILIDAGDTRYPDSSKNFRAYVSAQLPAGAEIDLAIASHPHSDHIGSMQWVLETYRVKTYVDNGQEHSSALYKNLLGAVRQQRQRGLDCHPYESVPREKEAICGPKGPQIRVLYPLAGLDPDVCEENQNNCSVVVKLTFRNTSFLFPGDAEHEEEELLLNDPRLKPFLNSDVLKVGHHGSDTSSGTEFIDGVSPSWMVISAGEMGIGTNKGYKHPRWSTIQELLPFAGPRQNVRQIDAYDAQGKRWQQARIWGSLYVTAKDGTVVLVSDGTAIRKE